MARRMVVGHAPHVTIESVGGDLRLVGWEAEELLAKVEQEGDLTVVEADGQLTLRCQDNLAVSLPRASRVLVRAVEGDMSVRGLAGDLQVDAVRGDLAMRDVGAVTLGEVGADFSLRRARGDVHVRRVGGDASLRELEGSLRLEEIADDLAVRGVGGDLVARVQGDVVVHLEPQAGREYTLQAGDDIMLLMPSEADACLQIEAGRVRVEWPGIEKEAGTAREVTLGAGAARVRLEAGGDVVITNRLDAVESADEYGNFAGMMFDWGGFGRDLGERITRRAQEVAERAAHKAGAAGRRAERHVRRGSSGKLNVSRWKWDYPVGGQAAAAVSATDEERLAILRMLADKVITAEQASHLLAALEGEV